MMQSAECNSFSPGPSPRRPAFSPAGPGVSRELGDGREPKRMHNNHFSTALMFIRHIFISAHALNFYKVPAWGANRAKPQAL